jgi:hypothetical protein
VRLVVAVGADFSEAARGNGPDIVSTGIGPVCPAEPGITGIGRDCCDGATRGTGSVPGRGMFAVGRSLLGTAGAGPAPPGCMAARTVGDGPVPLGFTPGCVAARTAGDGPVPLGFVPG